MYTDPVYLLNGLLDELGQQQDAEEWAFDVVRPQAWFTANHPDGRMVEVWIEHVSADALGTTALQLHRPFAPGHNVLTGEQLESSRRERRAHAAWKAERDSR